MMDTDNKIISKVDCDLKSMLKTNRQRRKSNKLVRLQASYEHSLHIEVEIGYLRYKAEI